MRNYRFYVKDLEIKNRELVIKSPELVHRFKNVLRLSETSQEDFEFFSGDGLVHYSKLTKVETEAYVFCVQKSLESKRELVQQIKFFVPIIKPENYFWMLRKLTELGVQKFYPVNFARSQKKYLESLSSAKQIEKAKLVIQEATEQCGGAKLAYYHEQIISLAEIFTLLDESEQCFFASERLAKPGAIGLNKLVLDHGSLALLVGPEGGLEDSEVSSLVNHQFAPVSLGVRLLKAETAALMLVGQITVTTQSSCKDPVNLKRYGS